MPVISTLKRLRQEDHEFRTHEGYRERLCVSKIYTHIRMITIASQKKTSYK